MKSALAVQARNINIVMDKCNRCVSVVVGIIIDSSSQILITKRALHLHQGGLWEFPGGKIEPDETPEQALKRELKEEIDVDVCDQKWLGSIEHQYPDKQVCLHVYQVTAFSGEPKMIDGQLGLQWVSLSDLDAGLYPLPAPNLHILSLLH